MLSVLAKLLAEPGKEIRAAALGSLEKAYEFQGEGVCPKHRADVRGGVVSKSEPSQSTHCA